MNTTGFDTATNAQNGAVASQPRRLLRGAGDIAVVAASPLFEQRVRRLLSTYTGPRMLRWPPSGPMPGLSGVSVVLIGPEMSNEDLIRRSTEILRAKPDAHLVLVADPNAALFEHAIRVGVKDLIAPGGNDEMLFDVLSRSLESAAQVHVEVAMPETLPPTVGLPMRDLPTPAAEGEARVISVMSPKGGIGKTFVATNLAVALAERRPNEIAMVDLDLQFGDLGNALKLTPEHTIVDVARATGSDLATVAKVFISHHDATGLYVMCSPDDPADADDITYEQSVAIVKTLSATFPVVVVDTSAGLDSHTLATAEVATDVVVVCSVDVASVRALRKELEALDRLGMRSQRRYLVLNRADLSGGARQEDIEQALGMRASLVLPFDRTSLTSVNQGVTVMSADPKSMVAKKFSAFADDFTGVPKESSTKQKSGLFRRSK